MTSAWESFIVVILGLFGGGFFGLPLSTPPLPADPVIERAAPDACLAHFELRGLAEPAGSSKNQTELLLAEPEVREFTTAFVAEAAKAIRQSAAGDPEAGALLDRLAPLLDAIARRPAALTVTRFALGPDGPGIEASLVVNVGADHRAVGDAWDALMADVLRGAPPEVRIAKATVAGGEWSRVASVNGSPELSWGFRGDHFVMAVGSGALESLLARLDDAARMPPAWKTAALKRMPVDRLATFAHVDVGAVITLAERMAGNPDLRRMLDATGVSCVGTVSAVTGLTAEGLAASTWIDFAGEPRGFFAPTVGRALGPDDLAAVPADALMAHAWKLDLAASRAALLAAFEETDPSSAARLQDDLARFRETFGMDLDRDILAALGDTWRLFLLPGGGPLVPNAGIVVSVRDRDRLVKSHAALLKRFRDAAADPASGMPVSVKETDYRGTTLFTLESQAPLPVTLTWCVTDDALIVSVSPQLMRTLLGRTRDDGSLADVPAVREAIARGGATLLGYLEPTSLVTSLCGTYEMLAPLARTGLAERGIAIEPPALPAPRVILAHARPSVSLVRRVGAEGLLVDSRGTLPLGPLSSGNGVVGGSPATTGVLVGLLLPAVQSAREAARRTTGMNNLRQLLLAMHIHADVKGGFPAPAVCDGDGKPLLSWRVAVLPYIEEGALYKEFHLDEPWDSEHNKKLLARMPEVYRDPAGPAGATTTTFVMPTGPGTLFPKPSRGPRLEEVTDGTTKTIALVEVNPEHAVPWTKPDDVGIDAADPAAALRGARPGGFLAGFADGHIEMLDATLLPETLRALFTPNGGETVTLD